ncbi:hypothetical protein [Microvirga antarctica]|uniref:hypothetical protein n=1 Tax=Microvirga antarctica TaxID=2819233 RepID=UPI001B30EA66|nr:hypothetical protein [Microvirga antarctica]
MTFDTNVFVNCPFDRSYYPLLRPLLFTICYMGLKPRIALESLDSGEARIRKIISLIEQSRFAIHDLSRLKAEKAGEYFRLNMPFELGLDVGCRLFKGGHHARKSCLILEAERYRYQAAISDLSNSDIAVHDNEPSQLTSEVRNWLSTAAKLQADGATKIWGRFNDFMADNDDALAARGFSPKDIENLPVGELIDCMEEWVRKNVNRGRVA